MKTSKMSKKLIPAIGMLLVSAITLSSATYAWFTMSKQATATGISLTATAPDNIQISVNSDAWYEAVTITSGTGTSADDALFLGLTGKLAPASTDTGIDGDIFYTDIAAQDGSSIAASSVMKTATAMSGSNDGFYVDVPISMRTTGNAAVPISLDLTGTTISGAEGNIYKAARIAFLSSDKTKNSNAGATGLIYGLNPSKAVATATPDSTTFALSEAAVPFIVGAATGVDSTTLFTLAASTPGEPITYTPTNFVVRIWIEGEDANCVSANGGQAFNVDLKFVAATTAA